MDAIAAIHTRRSIRDFTSRPVDRALIEAIVWDAAQTPPPFAGMVPWSFTVVLGAERIAEFGREALDYARRHRAAGSGSGWLDRDDFKVFWNAPAVLIISGTVEDCCRAGQTVLISAHARGLGTCWVGAPNAWLRTPGAQAALRIPDGLAPAATICLGYSASVPDARPRAKPSIEWVD